MKVCLGYFGVLLLSAALGACGGESEDKFSVALVYNQFGRVDDGSFCQSAYEGGMDAVRDFGIHLDYTPPQSQDNYDRQIEDFIEREFDFIISVGFHLMEATLQKAQEHPEIPFAIVDVAYEDCPPNLTAVVFREDQPGYLAGIVASHVTISKKLGCIGGMEIPPVKRYCNGFKQGVASHCPDCDTEVVFVGSFDDERAGEYNAQLMIDAERDVIFGAGGSMGSAAIKFAAQNDTWAVGVDLDEYRTTFQNGEEQGSQKLLTSALKRVDTSVYTIIKETLDGTLESGTLTFTAEAEGIGLAPYHEAEAAIPQSAKELVNDVYEQFRAGTLETGVDELGDIIE